MKSPIVIGGGGLVGLSVAYHLAKRGTRDVYLFERRCIGAHNASRVSTGMISELSLTREHTENYPRHIPPNSNFALDNPFFYTDRSIQSIVRKSHDLYTELSAQGSLGLKKCGRVYLSSSQETEMQARRLFSRLSTDPANSSAELIDCPSELINRWPMLATEDIRLAVFSPLDATIDVQRLCQLLAERCRDMGVHIHENVEVKRVLLNENQRLYAVDTDEGFLETSTFLNAAGIWASLIEVPDLPDRQVRLTAHPCAYTFLSTEPLPQRSSSCGDVPIFIGMDENIFICPTEFRTICGGFVEGDLQALTPPVQTKGGLEWHIPAPNWDNFTSVLRHLINRCPPLSQLARGELITGAEMYTPDMRPLIGESDQAHGYFIINGMNGQGLSFAGGLGYFIAEWMLEGRPSSSSSVVVDKLDVARFLPLHSSMQYLFQRVPEVNLTYSHQYHTARNLRTSPIHHHLRAKGAVFAETMGYERALWYEPSQSNKSVDDQELTMRSLRQSLFASQDQLVGKPPWFALVAKEYETCRERVGLIDMTSFSKFDINGKDVVPFLQKLCSANIDRPVGTTIYTGMQNEYGGYVTDATVSRMGNDSYFLVAPTIQQTRLALWVRRWANELGMDVKLQDVTNNYTALDLIGPASRDLLKSLTGENMSPSEFPSFAFRKVHIGLAGPIRAISVTHCGELGWMLYIPNELVQNAYEQLVDAGEEYSLRHCGYYALRHLRIEKFYVFWGQDINSMTTPVECGRVFRVDFNKDFIGKEAIERQMERGISKRFVQLLIEGHDLENDPWPQGDEPIYRDGSLAGWTTTAAYGFTLGCHVCLGFVQNERFGVSPEFINRGTYEVELAGKRFPCRVNLHSPSLPMISSEHPQHYRPTQ